MKILIIGNLGYIGPGVARRLRKSMPKATLVGFDIGYFAHSLTDFSYYPEIKLDCQYYGDVRKFPYSILMSVDVVIYLAAISNDPMGNEFEIPTNNINLHSAVKIAKESKKVNVGRFIYASSCSVYGSEGETIKTEKSTLNPLTTYAKSKIESENQLKRLADDSFNVTCLRFATACGFSSRLRLDLVLNDFVASAITARKIEILSDGTPWRPLIHVKDMARAIEWASKWSVPKGYEFLAVNTGSNSWNYQIRELAFAVSKILGEVEIVINEKAPPDKRSYKVDFSLFKSLAGDFYPQVTLQEAIKEIYNGLKKIKFKDKSFRNSNLMRLRMLQTHIKRNKINDNLEWK